jgi:hypothetical protein
MEILLGFLGAALALLAIFFLYVGGAAVVLRLVDWVRPTKSAHDQGPNIPVSPV